MATMQLMFVGVLIAGAAAYLARESLKTWFGASGSGCGSGCGKCTTTSEQPQRPGRYPLPQA
jgi:hypothetical protein